MSGKKQNFMLKMATKNCSMWQICV